MNSNEAFLVYKSFYEPIKFLSDEQMGKLFKAIFEYQINGTEEELEPQINMAFQFFKNQFRVDNNKYEEIRTSKSEGGKKGGGNPNFKKGQTNPYYKKDNQEITRTYPENNQDITKDNCKDNQNIIQPAKIDNSDNLDKDSLYENKDTLTDINKINTHKLNENENENENENVNVAREVMFKKNEEKENPEKKFWEDNRAIFQSDRFCYGEMNYADFNSLQKLADDDFSIIPLARRQFAQSLCRQAKQKMLTNEQMYAVRGLLLSYSTGQW